MIVAARLTCAKSASGASSGIASAPCPELDGIRKASGMFTTTVTTRRTLADAPLTSCSIELRMVSSVCVLVMITDTPPRQQHDHRRAEHVRGAGGDQPDRLLLAHPGDEADEHRGEDEQHRELREPPVQLEPVRRAPLYVVQ